MRTLFLFLFHFISISCFGQNHFALQNFTAFIKDSHIVLQWTMKQGNTCFGTGILRSENNSEFSEIGLIGGVCGSSDIPVSYTFVDSFPIENKISYYKLDLGLLGKSQYISITYYTLDKNNSIVIPNPFSVAGGRIIFSHEPIEVSKVLVYNSRGELIYTSKPFLNNYFDINHYSFLPYQSGQYYFSIINVEGKIISTGSFVYRI